MKVRRAVTEDQNRLIYLWSERINLLAQVDKRFTSDSYADGTLGKQIHEYMDDENSLIFVAVVDDTIVGFIVVKTYDSFGLINEMALDAHQYHGGVGRYLVKHVLEYFSEGNEKQIIVKVPRFHPVEQAFWLALGAKEWKDQAWKNPPELMWMIL